jgi:hypothetical protein
MKSKLLLLTLLLLAAVISYGQSELPWKEKRKLKKQYKQAEKYHESEAPQWDINIPPDEMVGVPILGIESFTNWGKEKLLPEDVEKRLYEAAKYPVVVKIFDTSQKYFHDDLQEGQLPGADYTGDNTPEVDQGHGIHVGGIIAGDEGGIAYQLVKKGLLKYKAVQVLNDGGSGSFAGIANAINSEDVENKDYINKGTAVITNGSLGGGTAKNTAVDDALKKSVQNGSVYVFAAGNSGGPVRYPGNSDYTIGVSSLDNNLKISSFSSRGPEVHTTAPGRGINSTYKNNGYASLSGTSMATPFVSGLAAIAYSVWGIDAIGDQYGLLAYLKSVATDLGEEGKDDLYGYGLAFVQAILDTPPGEEPDGPTCEDGIQNGNETGIDCGGDCPPCDDEPDEPNDPIFAQRIVPVVIEGEWRVFWRDFGSMGGYNATRKEGSMEGVNEFGEPIIATFLPQNDYRSGYIYVTSVTARVKSTKPSEQIVKEIRQAINEQWERRGLLLSSPADAAVAIQWTAYFMDLFATRDYGQDVVIGEIVANDGNGGEFVFSSDELRQYPINTQPYDINLSLGNDNVFYYESGEPAPFKEISDWYVVARWGKENSINVNAPGLPNYGKVDFVDVVGTYTTRMKYGGTPPIEKVREIKPAGCKDCKLIEILNYVKIN